MAAHSLLTNLRSCLACLLVLAAALFLCSCSATYEHRDIPAFPGAEGFGSVTPGGRGGKVIFVTNLNDSGPGSLRAACDTEGARIVIFRVSGLITLATPIVVRHPYLTLAGQTAPGDGICLRNNTFTIATHDVVVRYLRSRLGDFGAEEGDCISVQDGAHNVILDHCSVSWSTDEALSLGGDVSNITVQWCIIAEALNRSKHAKGSHGYGSLIRANGSISLHHNLWAHNNARNPRFGDNYGKPLYPTFDFRNNVIYNYGSMCSGLTQGEFTVNYVANYIRPGPSSVASLPIQIGSPSAISFYLRDNIFEGKDHLTADNSLFFDQSEVNNGWGQLQIAATPFLVSPVRTHTAQEAYEAVLYTAGAMLPARDSVDARIVDEVRLRQGSIIDSQMQVRGWPDYATSRVHDDQDNDGMPDEWEVSHGLNPHDPHDASLDRDADGYTNIEEYINKYV